MFLGFRAGDRRNAEQHAPPGTARESDSRASYAVVRCCTRGASPDPLACVLHAHEPVLIQALVTEAPVEALDVGVLDGFAGTNEGNAYRALIRPGVVIVHDSEGPQLPAID